MGVLADLKAKYGTAVKLLEEESRKDPDDEPYRSQYKAKNILSEMETLISTSLSDHPDRDPMLATIYLQMGVISVDTEEQSMGEEFLMKGFNLISDHLNKKLVICSINIRNQLGILWSQRSESGKAQTWLEGAEKLYEDFKGKSPQEKPLTAHELFGESDADTGVFGEKEMERVHTLTKFYLAQVYGTQKDLLKSAIYCHETLRRQLIFNEYGPIDWALNSATLSQFFMERTLFKQARHHLAAASYVLDEYETKIEKLEESGEEIEAKKKELRHRRADVSRCWAKYGIFLLECSKDKLNGSETEKEENTHIEGLKNLWFTTLDLSKYENEILASEVVLYESARHIFLVTQKHINIAKEYYSLEDYASDHVQIVQDHSQLFRHLTEFENDKDKECKMIKRRVDLLQGVLKELNPQYYLHACRQLWFELGETYHDMMQIKFQRMKESNEVTPHSLKKINFLAEHSIENFNQFLDSYKNNSTKKLPEELEEDMIKPILIAHFYLGRLYYKIVTPDRIRQIENTNKSYACFKYFVEYCEKSEFARKILSEQLNISKEMMTLLQMKILQI